ncbi:hypothetical protein [Paenibacillus sp. CF384]|uniref:hypothetical protein n=1 Tax=Paenibacillus sp. CF384 TaxID=1884382 RepID=UPI00089D9C8F|nr:hypothetical protein [Paenibacillus sp. CF384]SDX05247.1 hypothetical protein SAMN05518855_100869 [Paenibacillus sp. CF384]
MKNAFLRFSWGVVILLIDFRIGWLDILPDIVGYALMWNAVIGLGQYRSNYLKAQWPAALLTLFSVAEVLPFFGEPVHSFDVSPPWLAYGSMMLFLQLLLVNWFLLALCQHAIDTANHNFAVSVNRCRMFVIFVNVVSLISFPFSINWSQTTVMMWSILILGMGIISELALIFICRRAATTVGKSD